ncbi:ABC transporter substrate-binding protein [Pseudonocardia dioxanivorans]|uniref:ABC transporter substrate-binding protein n=1 Tax=Pseudonocardia dioxanivorans TaxID=240495 RepID=UPI000CD0C742|nr:ABC transporter substrate-binding protein [Pseudonocardia dioxanivorans]
MSRIRSTMRSIGLALAGLSLGALAACGGGSGNTGGDAGQASQASGAPVRIALVNGFGSLPIHVADTMGFFKKHGVNAQVLENTSTASFGPGLGKQFDFILSTPMDFLSAAAKGIDITAVSGMYVNSSKSPNNVLLTKNDSIKTIADLKGKRVGVVSQAGTSYGSTIYALDKAGVSKNDVTFVATPFATMEDQMQAGNLDAAVYTAPYWSSSITKGFRIVEDIPFAVAGEGTPNAFFSSSSAYAKANPQVIQGFRDAMKEAVDWVNNNPDQARQQIVDWLKLPAPIVAQAPLPALDTSMTVEKLQPFVPIAQVSGQVTTPIPNLKTLIWSGGAT